MSLILPLVDQYRPHCWAEVVGQDKILAKLDTLRKRTGTLGGRSYFVSGSSGTGKTTIARLIADEIAPGDWSEFDAKDLNAEAVAGIKWFLQAAMTGLFRDSLRKVWIINEVHTLRSSQITDLLTLLEPSAAGKAQGLPSGCAFIFTTTTDGRDQLFEDNMDASPFLSRCVPLALSRRDLAEPFARRLLQIAQAEGLDGQPLERYMRLVRDNRLNMRACLQQIEAGELLAN